MKSPDSTMVLLKVFSSDSWLDGEVELVELGRQLRSGERGQDGVEGVAASREAIAASSAGGGGKWNFGLGKEAGKVRYPYVIASTST